MAAPVATTGPLQFEGFWLSDDDRTAQPGEKIQLVTAWRVIHGPEHPLSIMAHLLDAQGRVVSGGDGLGVPIEAWQIGDAIAQEHTLSLPPDLAPGTYWLETGVYRLDTMERYQVLQAGSIVGDRLFVAPVEVKR